MIEMEIHNSENGKLWSIVKGQNGEPLLCAYNDHGVSSQKISCQSGNYVFGTPQIKKVSKPDLQKLNHTYFDENYTFIHWTNMTQRTIDRSLIASSKLKKKWIANLHGVISDFFEKPEILNDSESDEEEKYRVLMIFSETQNRYHLFRTDGQELMILCSNLVEKRIVPS